MSDAVTSWLRTVVPGLWSAAVTAALTWLGTHAPWAIEVLDLLHVDPTSPATIAFVVSVVLAGWYALWRWLEPRLPAWATRLTLGSNKTPAYAAVSADGVPSITSVDAPEGHEVPEVSDAKTEVVDILNQLDSEDRLTIGDRQVERLIEMGWRPTGRTQ